MKPPLPPDEAQRLEALRQYDVLDTPAEAAFDDLTLLASQICQTPIAMVSLVDEKRQWFKSKVGMDATETSRDIAFCAHTILDTHEVMEVRDATADPRFVDSPLVTTDPHIRFYAGAPLVSHDGQALGALCVMDRKPHTLTPEQLAALRALSRHVVAQLELKRHARELASVVSEREKAEALLQQQFYELTASKQEADRLLEIGKKSRRALLSVLEDEKRAGENLRLSEELNRGVLDSVLAHIAVLDRDGKIIAVNDSWRQFARDNGGNEPALLARTEVGTNYLEVCRNSRGEFSAEAMLAHDGLQAVLREEKHDFTYEYPCHSPKVKRWFILSATPLKTKNGGAVVSHTDITERRKLEEQYRQSQKMEVVGQLAGGVAHDFNNMLAVFQMQTDLIKDSDNLTAEQVEFTNEITDTVQRASALTRQLLMFSRREVFQPRDLDLGESIAATAKMLKRLLGENIRMQLKLASQPMFVHADASMMDQVLMNLAVNARDAMPNGGHLIIETSGVEFDEFAVIQSPQTRVGSFVRLSVSDSGCGIPPENLQKIFEPFFTTKDIGKGTGLGLATVFGIVQQHQGWINVYSEINHGTTFRIYLPRLAKNGTHPSAQPASPEIRGGNETILLVEDDPSLRVSVRLILSKFGYRIVEAPTGVKALEVWKQNRDEILLLLTDLVMPDGMSGKDLGQRLLQENPKLKVIYMSGYSAEIVGKDFPLKEGVNFLTKPFQAQKLAQTVRTMLDK